MNEGRGNRRHLLRGSSINLYYLPALILFAVFIVYPVIRGVALSGTNWNGFSHNSNSVGLVNYKALLTDANFVDALRNTFIYGVGSTLIQQVLGLALAIGLDRAFKGRAFLRSVIYLPVLVSPVVMGTMYYLIFRYQGGAANDVVGLWGDGPVAWLSNEWVAIAVIVFVNSLQFVGISMLIYLSGLQSVPQELYEASSLDGAGPWRQFRSVTVPMLIPAFTSSVTINLIGGLKLFDIISVLTGGGPGYSTNSISTLIGRTYFGSQQAGYAAAMGTTLFAIIAVMTVITNLAFDKARERVQ